MLINSKSLRTLKNIRFWILLFFIVRLIGITNPPLEVGHNWRQTTVTMVARNFLEVDSDIMHPRVDIAGDLTGITGMEFPILNHLIYRTSLLFGYEHWYGRLINLILSSLGILFFHRLVMEYFDKRTAFFASLILLFSICFSFSRKIMPDTFAASLVIMSLYYGSRFLKCGPRRFPIIPLVASALLAMIGVLAKLPMAVLLTAFAPMLLLPSVHFSRKLVLSLVLILSMGPVLFWYFEWVPKLVEEFGFWHFYMGNSFSQGLAEVSQDLGGTAKRFYDTALKFSGFSAFLLGSYFMIRKRQLSMGLVLAITLITFLIFILKAGQTFAHHSYYIIPFVPVMALIAGYGLACIKDYRIAVSFMAIIALEGVLNQYDDFIIKDDHAGLLALEADLDRFSSRDDLILINSGNIPTPMYFAHRKGWVMNNERISKPQELNALGEKGLRYIVVLKKVMGSNIELPMPLLMENEDYRIYKMSLDQ